jgi:hypothetical protein
VTPPDLVYNIRIEVRIAADLKTCRAELDGGVLFGVGPNPLAAVAALADAIREWQSPNGGAERWLKSVASLDVRREFLHPVDVDEKGNEKPS